MIDFKVNYVDSDLRDVVIGKEDKSVEITYGGNLDLYFNVFGNSEDVFDKEYINKKIEFVLNKEDEAYSYFDTLINNINKDNHKSLLVTDGVINWYSDDTYKEAADILSIFRDKDNIKLVFYNNPNEMHFGIPVRISNSGSRYEPLNVYFMELYNSLQDLAKQRDDTNTLERKLY